MRALKLKRMNLLKNISDATESAARSYKSQKKKESNVNKIIDKEIKLISSRPSQGPLSEIDTAKDSKEFKTRPERNLKGFQERVIKSMPLLESYPSQKEKDHVHEQQLKTWTKALDDRLWSKKVSSVLHTMNDVKILEQAKKEIEQTRVTEQRKKESKALKSIKSELNERVRRAVRMEHRLQVAHEDVENIKLKRSFREERVITND